MKAPGAAPMSGLKALGIYIHIPFCLRKCLYCDFLSGPADLEVQERYVQALCREICEESGAYKGYQVETVFFFFLTPSLLKGEQIFRILETLYGSFHMAEVCEISMEMNPGTADWEKMTAFRKAGINRLSIGLQSACDEELKALGRIHNSDDFFHAYRMAGEAGFTNINVDLMSALPFQTEESFYATLRSVSGLAPKHLSVYSLIVEENTPLYDWVHAGNEDKLPSEETERNMYYRTREILEEYGYYRYEVSNYAKPGYECRHNLGYWERKEYAGFGLGAASLVKDRRYNNVSDWNEYIESCGSRKVNEELLEKKDAMAEFMFLGLRKTKGIDKQEFFDMFDVEYDSVYGKVTKRLTAKGFLRVEEQRVMLTDLGIDVSNVVLAEFLPD